jgi:hypothetical protein
MVTLVSLNFATLLIHCPKFKHFTDYYHVNYFMGLLDLSSPRFISRIEPDRAKYVPDHGAQCILEECIRRWEGQIESTNPTSDKWSIADSLWRWSR